MEKREFNRKFNERVGFKSAFTLAEVLITLGVIGIVAAMTIPTLMAKIQEHKTVSALKETFSILAQSVKLLEEQDEGKPEEWDITGWDRESAELIGEKFKKVLKVAVDCGVTNEKNCIYEGEYQYLDDRDGVSYAAADTNYKLMLLNGSTLMFFGGPGTKRVKILVDTNGTAPPNTWGRDLFEIDYITDVGFILDGSGNGNSTRWDDPLGCAKTGWGCAYYVVTFGNMKYLNKKK